MDKLHRFRSGSCRRPLGTGTRGVTLLELLIVITMIGILSAVAMTRLDWKRYQADAAGRGAMAELATAQRLALSLQSNMVVSFIDSTRMQILEDANNDGTAGASERIRTVVLDNNFYFGKASAPDLPAPEDPSTFTTLTFHRDGSADKSASLYLHGPGLDTACKHCRAIAINRATGRVVWYSYASGSWRRIN
jgi:prepilin-type N-terminal cleavage/methylation domain-containing protein